MSGVSVFVPLVKQPNDKKKQKNSWFIICFSSSLKQQAAPAAKLGDPDTFPLSGLHRVPICSSLGSFLLAHEVTNNLLRVEPLVTLVDLVGKSIGKTHL